MCIYAGSKFNLALENRVADEAVKGELMPRIEGVSSLLLLLVCISRPFLYLSFSI